MRAERKVLIAAVLALVAVGSGCTRGDGIIKVADLPQTADFEMDMRQEYAPPSMVTRKVHVDVGYLWKQNSLFFMPILNDNGHYVGYTGNDAQYVELKKGELVDWTGKTNISLPPNPSIPFWDAWGGKLLLIVLIPPFAILSLLLDRLWRRITTGM